MRKGPDGVAQLVELDPARQRLAGPAPMVISDIAPYRSIRTGETIDGRAQHREHLRR